MKPCAGTTEDPPIHSTTKYLMCSSKWNTAHFTSQLGKNHNVKSEGLSLVTGVAIDTTDVAMKATLVNCEHNHTLKEPTYRGPSEMDNAGLVTISRCCHSSSHYALDVLLLMVNGECSAVVWLSEVKLAVSRDLIYSYFCTGKIKSRHPRNGLLKNIFWAHWHTGTLPY